MNITSKYRNDLFVISVISFEFSKIAFLYRKFGDYGYSAIWHCHAL